MDRPKQFIPRLHYCGFQGCITMRTLAFIVASITAFGAVPTISNISLTDQRYNSVRVKFDVSPTASYCAVLVGTSSGNYGYQPTKMYSGTNDGGGGHCSLAIAGLKAATTYYLLPIAQPNNTNTTDRCDVSGCGAVEQTYTTASAPSLPIEPTAPTVYNPTIDTTGYVTVPMTDGGTGGQCRAASSVPSRSVVSGDLLQTVLNNIPYQTILEFPQGITCIAIAADFNGAPGYVLPQKSNDASCSSGWIVLRTADDGTLPPDGVQADPQLAANYAVFQSNNIASGDSIGEIFHTDYSGFGSTLSRCYALESLTFQANPADTSPHKSFLSFGVSSAGDVSSDALVARHLYFKGSATYGNTRGINVTAKQVQIADSWVQNVFSTSQFAVGVMMEAGGTGPYTFQNNTFKNLIGEAFYSEVNNGSNPAANDVTCTQNTFYWDMSLKDSGYLVRQQIEFKGGHRINCSGNIVDGAWVYQNDSPAFFLSGTNNYVNGSGISNVLIEHNLIRNVPTVFDCSGTRTADNNPAADNPVTAVVMFRENLAYNLGYYQHIGSGASGGGLVNALSSHKPGCANLTVTGNTFGFSNPEDGPGSMITYIPALYSLGGGTTFAPGFRHTNNIQYVSMNPGNDDRIFIDNPQSSASFPRTPAVTTGSTPLARLQSFAITFDNGGTATDYTWSGNVNICAKVATGTNTWADQNSSQCTTTATGMPSGDTWASGNTTSAREADIGLNTSTWACSGCGGAGISKAALIPYLGITSNIGSVTVTSSTAQFSYTAPDTDACYTQLSSDAGATWGAFVSDGGGSTSRTPTRTGLTSSTAYQARIVCKKQQLDSLAVSSESWPSDQVTTVSFTTAVGVSKTLSGGMTMGGGITF
jgi:hypothetical protein